jgi:type IV pilus assembly protein PilE
MLGRGFSLFELLVVLLVVAVIAAVALPAYRQHVIRVNRSEATVALHDLRTAEERFYLLYGRYTSDVVSVAPDGLGLQPRSHGGRYALSVAVSTDGQTFVATASPTLDGSQASDAECMALSIDDRGRRAVSGSREVMHCWR